MDYCRDYCLIYIDLLKCEEVCDSLCWARLWQPKSWLLGQRWMVCCGYCVLQVQCSLFWLQHVVSQSRSCSPTGWRGRGKVKKKSGYVHHTVFAINHQAQLICKIRNSAKGYTWHPSLYFMPLVKIHCFKQNFDLTVHWWGNQRSQLCSKAVHAYFKER